MTDYCAYALLREMNNKEYKKAVIAFPDYEFPNIWEKYIQKSLSLLCQKLGRDDGPAFYYLLVAAEVPGHHLL